MGNYSLGPITELLLIACIVAIMAQWMHLPYSIALVLMGLVVALTKLTPFMAISQEVVFSLILPPLLFQGAMHMDWQALKKNWRLISILAVPGVIMTMLVAGLAIHYVLKIDWPFAFLFGALIAPTDPVSVLTILKNVGAPERLRTILEGESIFNDGTGVVLFSVLLSLISGHKHFEFSNTIYEFLRIVGGSVLIGGGLGYLVCHWMKSINDHLLEVTIMVVLVFGTPMVADYFHCSGVLAVVIAGLIMGNYGRQHAMSAKTRTTIETFWETIDFILNSLVFLIIGIELQVLTKADMLLFWNPVLSGILIILFTRAAVVYLGVWLHNLTGAERIPLRWSHVLFWGGLRGAIPLALVAGLPEFDHRTFFMTIAFGIVLFSLVVQGLTLKPLIRCLKISPSPRG